MGFDNEKENDKKKKLEDQIRLAFLKNENIEVKPLELSHVITGRKRSTNKKRKNVFFVEDSDIAIEEMYMFFIKEFGEKLHNWQIINLSILLTKELLIDEEMTPEKYKRIKDLIDSLK